MNANQVGSAHTQRLEVRPRKVRIVAVAVAVVLIAVFTFVGISLRHTPTGAYFRVSDQVSMIGFGLLLGGAALLFTRARLRADHTGVEVRNVLLAKHYTWDAINGISFPDGAPWARVDLPADEYTPILAIQATDGERAVVAMRRLRELRRQAEQHQEPDEQHDASTSE